MARPRRRRAIDGHGRSAPVAAARTSSCATTPARDRWLILAPERVFTPDAIAVAVLKLCDGQRSVADIAGELAKDL